MRRKTKKRTSLRPTPFLVIFLIANGVAGLLASRLTVVRRVRVEGAADWDKARLETIVERVKGKPCAQINRYIVESSILEDPATRTASFDRNPFGSAVLRVTYQVPVARFYNHTAMAISEEGVIFRSAHLPENIPTLDLSNETAKTFVTLASDFPTLAIAKLARKVKVIFPAQPVRIEYGTGSSLCLNIGTSQVILGSCDGLETKLGKLQEKLASDPDFLSKVKTYNLLDPQNPMTVPK